MSLVTPRKGYKSVPWLFGKEIEIPEEWKVSKLSDSCEKTKDIVAGPFGSNLVVSDYTNEGIPIIRLQNIQRNEFIDKNIKFITKEKAKELDYHSYIAGDLVLAKLGEIVGKTCKIPDDFPNGIIVADVVRIRISTKKSDQNFIEYVLNSKLCDQQHIRETIGTTRSRVNLEQIRNLQFPKPTLPEQQKIASILSNIDFLIESTSKVIENSKIVKTGLMQKLLTRGIDHTKFKKIPWLFGKEIEIPEEWETEKLQNVTDKIGDGIHSTPNYVDNSEYYFINGNNLINGKIIFSKNTKNVSKEEFLKYELKLNQNTILLSINGTIGNVAFYNNEKIVLGKSASYIVCNSNLDAIFFFYLLQSSLIKKYFSTQLTGTTIFNLSLGSIRNMKLYKPSLPEQQKIATILSNIDDKIDSQEQYKEKLLLLKKSLMQKLLTGEVRV